MLSNKPYLLRAFYEWIVDSNATPVLVVAAEYPDCKVPEQFIRDGEIILNISPNAVRDLKLGNKFVEFRASFASVVHLISVPVGAVRAIYTHENGAGMYFDDEEGGDTVIGGHNAVLSPVQSEANSPVSHSNTQQSKKPHLMLVE